ncbi:unnamed protein product [Vicia faba]|uniref:Uncharacterized protein n=1 Tax=Vicia faba TaxID=3906 RepID=A0AAV0YIN6_VICFA|nr:unnamed protein product [Vicia faba]CAI8583721.1 unnamed protein product [Vicia faba]CAI8584649.1 unnamed protein product [Vicia faba]
MDRTVSRRSEPSSRTALMGEQPNPWNLLQLQVAKSRHRGAKPSRRCELLGKISLLSLDQAPFCLCTRGPISVWPEETFARLRYLLGGLRPIETVYLRLSLGLSWDKVRILALPEWYLTDGSSPPGRGPSLPST